MKLNASTTSNCTAPTDAITTIIENTPIAIPKRLKEITTLPAAIGIELRKSSRVAKYRG